MQHDNDRQAAGGKKASFVEFMGSIKFDHRAGRQNSGAVDSHFAALQPKARPARAHKAEDDLLVRSAN